jgi:hypothetical protein
VFTVVETQPALPSDTQYCEPVIVFVLAERTSGSLKTPLRSTTTARKEPQSSGVVADQLRHRGQGTTGGAISAKPAFLVPPVSERKDHWKEVPSKSYPA